MTTAAATAQMTVTVSLRDLLRELELLNKVAAQKPTLPILANLLVQADGNGLRLAATDLEIGLITFCPATVHLPGSTTLPVKHLLEITRLLGDQDITLSLEGTQVKLTAGRYNSKLMTFPASDFVILPSMQGLPTVELPKQFQTMINRVRFAISDKDKRYFMDGGLLTKTSLAATDGHRLAYTTCDEYNLAEPVILPRKVLDKLSEMLTADAIFAVGERHLFFVVEGRLLFSRMAAGQFPNYERIIPRDTTHTMTIPRVIFQDVVRRIVLTSNEVVLRLGQNTMSVFGRSASIGDALEQIDILYEGPDTAITLQGGLLMDFLNVAVSPSLNVQWKDQCPMMFTDGSDYAYIQMPLRNA